MKKLIALGIMLVASANASAGLYTDDLSRCLIKSLSEADKIAFVKWTFGAISVHPSVKSISNATDSDRTEFNATVGKLADRLMLEDCRKEALDALKYEGPGAVQASFEVLGSVAMRSLMSDPAVLVEIERMGKGIDSAKWSALFKESGLPTAPDNKAEK